MGLFDNDRYKTSGILARGLEESTGFVSPKRQLRRMVAETDYSSSDSVQNTFNQLMKVSPRDAAMWIKQVKPMIEAQQQAQPDTRKQQLIAKENRNIAASNIAQGFGPRDTMKQKQELVNKLSAAGLGDTSMSRLVTDEINAFKAEHFRQQKEQRLAKTQEEKAAEQVKAARWKPVFEPGQAKSVIFNMINTGELEAGGLNTEEKKTMADAMGAVVNIYDNKLATQRGAVSPQVAANYYTKVLQLPEVYQSHQKTDLMDPKTLFTEAEYSHENFTAALDKVFGQGNAAIKSDELERYFKKGLVIPGVTVIETPAGRRTLPTQQAIEQFKKDNKLN